MNNNDITLDELMDMNGFKNFDNSIKSIESTKPKKQLSDLILEMHQKGPHVLLKQFGMWNPRSDLPYKSMEYTNYYSYNDKLKCYDFLMSIEYNVQKTITESSIIIDYNNISENCALYYIELHDSQNNKINENMYKIYAIPDFENKYEFDINLDDGFICGETYECLRYFAFNEKGKILNDFLSFCDTKGQKFIFPEGLKHLKIVFNDDFDLKDVNVVLKVYNIYRYCGFFGSGWAFHF